MHLAQAPCAPHWPPWSPETWPALALHAWRPEHNATATPLRGSTRCKQPPHIAAKEGLQDSASRWAARRGQPGADWNAPTGAGSAQLSRRTGCQYKHGVQRGAQRVGRASDDSMLVVRVLVRSREGAPQSGVPSGRFPERPRSRAGADRPWLLQRRVGPWSSGSALLCVKSWSLPRAIFLHLDSDSVSTHAGYVGLCILCSDFVFRTMTKHHIVLH